jgi:hypothetical protein
LLQIEVGTNDIYGIFKFLDLLLLVEKYGAELYWPWLRNYVLEPLMQSYRPWNFGFKDRVLLAKQTLAPGLQPMSIGWDPRVLGGVLYVLRCRVTQRFSRVCSHAIKQWPQRIIPRPTALTHTSPLAGRVPHLSRA